MNLKEFWGHSVVIQAKNKKVFFGEVNDYIYPEDNENGKDSIILDPTNGGNPIEFYENDIKSVQVMK